MAKTSLWLLLVLAAASVLGVLLAWRRQRGEHDMAYVGAALPWMLWLGADLWQASASESTPAPEAAAVAGVSRLAYQCMLIGAAKLLLRAATTRKRRTTWPLMLLLLLAGMLAAWSGDPAVRSIWLVLNVVAAGIFTLVLVSEVRAQPTAQGWMALLIALSGLSLVLTDFNAMRTGTWDVALHHFFLMTALFCLWLALRRRIVEAPPPTGWMNRQQLAQELHDGVGSHLISILSTLDASSPQQRLTAASLQNCLLDLKLLVDGMEEDASLLSHMASLRYRMQPLLEQAGIELEWQVANDERLRQVRGDAAKHVLRLTQEALANAVHHSGARTVTVLCRHWAEIDSLLLCIADDGSGIAPNRRASMGKGLRSMRRRAQGLGGRLSIDSNADGGTVVRLLVPMSRLHPAAGAREAVTH